ncbi:hypothetical protein BDV93DRAFT_520202 [Ceratobasidium sp. AG-I]|nr:hypothetical protein BDV93DRAFT_520202 [Ceratobasidium sp. AG-I]
MEAASSNQVRLRQAPSHDANNALLRLRYLLVKALLKGSTVSRRPGLPQAVVTRICSLAQFTWAHPAVSHDCQTSMIVPSRGPEEKVPWFRTAPFTSEILGRVTSFQLSTDSHDQGWVDDPSAGSYTWYQIRVINPHTHPEGKLRENGSSAVWDSHRNRVGNFNSEFYRGMLFDAEHEIFKYLRAGDCLEVTANAMCPGWVNYADRGTLEVFTQWEPSSKMMELIYSAPSKPALTPTLAPVPELEPTNPIPVHEDAPNSQQPSGSNVQVAPPANDEFAARFQSLRERLKSRFG